MQFHYFQHVPFEELGSIADWIENNGHQLTVTRFNRPFQLPDVQSIGALIVMGGPMRVNDEDQFPWLAREKKFIEAFIALQKPLLGICLGSQLIAAALGFKPKSASRPNPDRLLAGRYRIGESSRATLTASLNGGQRRW